MLAASFLLLAGCAFGKDPIPTQTATHIQNEKILTETAQGEFDMKNATLSFHSFDGGGPNFSAAVEDAALLTCTQTKEYEKKITRSSPARASP